VTLVTEESTATSPPRGESLPKRLSLRQLTGTEREMTKRGAQNALLVPALLAVGALGWWLTLRTPLVTGVRPLAALPTKIGAWQAHDTPMPAAVEDVLEADFNIQRTYYGPAPAPVWLYVGYYGTARGGRPEHIPRGCYTGAGWTIERARVLDVDPDSGLRVNEYRLARAGEQRLVHFWFRSHLRTGMIGGLDQNFDRIVGRLFHGRADGALVRVSTPILSDGEILARGRLMAFAASLDPLLGQHWPTEQPDG